MDRQAFENTSLLVVSCDKFKDAWLPLERSFKENWPHCPFQSFILTNHLLFKSKIFSCLRVGDDLDWSQNLLKALQILPTSNVLLWLDDVFLKESVDNECILDDINFFRETNLNYLRLRNTNIIKQKGYYKIASNDPYKTSIFATLWNIQTLCRLIVPGESPWQFELSGSRRARELEGFFSVGRSRFKYVHAIEKGIWLRSAERWMRARGFAVDAAYRPIMSKKASSIRLVNQVKGLILNLLPGKMRSTCLSFVRQVRKAVGISKP